MIVGFVGLGAMGLPMAQNLVRRQFRVRGFDMRREAVDALAQAGGVAAGSAREAAEGADALVLMVVNAAQAEAVLFDASALEALAPGATVIVMATCPPAAAKALAERVAATGRSFVDAPVSGGVVGAIAGTLTIMASAPKAVFEGAKPVLSALGDKLFHVGEEPGQGSAVKTVNQLLCGVHIAAAAEGLALAEKAGIDGRIFLEILGGSAASSWMLKDRGPRMLEDEPRVTSAVDIFVKDLGIVLDAGRASKSATPLAAVAHQFFLSASAQGLGGKDDSQVVEVYRALAGMK
ncbi:NAD(P)-dependent oxidoreductase [Alsobacter soli]|uniref:NAD(P)-dependent oxidoreductase n=1 Tax=Alsobacter soli TaxID=2109933 RepID=A0A2T1HP64_9HYPH|nr:NAD(P)-dependent oxidoreductase [Alsobacter soli]PSC03452.1 NAD(P)-dependent oxidoreductase [Alsobacter soli]